MIGAGPAPVEPFIPMMLFAIVFGLSMDYEVFLLSRVKEEYDRTGDPVGSVADGLAATARVITAAAAIMIVVFAGFVLEDNRVLFGVADCELYFFAEAGRDGTIRRYYWVQFEGYAPSRPELHYTSALPVVQLGGLDFHVLARFGPGAGEVPKPGSELEHLLPLIAAKGLKLPPGIVNVRFQHFHDERRKELMIIYGEDVALSGVTLAELRDGEMPSARWPAVEAAIIARAAKRLKIGRP